MAYTNRIAWEPLRSIDAATFTGSFQALGTALAHPGYIVKMVNNSTVPVTISVTGVASSDVDICPAGSFWLYDEGKVAQCGSEPSLPQGTQIFVKGAAGVGSVYLVVQYIVVR